ncbi:MAG: barstar family protein [Wenzhouxiangella sp.]
MKIPRSLPDPVAHWLAGDDALLFLARTEATGLAALLAEHNITPLSVDLSGISDKAGLMAELHSALGLGDWFGANWDALNDALYELAEPAGGQQVLLLEMPAGELELPEADIQTLLDILRDVAASSSSPLRGTIVLH